MPADLEEIPGLCDHYRKRRFGLAAGIGSGSDDALITAAADRAPRRTASSAVLAQGQRNGWVGVRDPYLNNPRNEGAARPSGSHMGQSVSMMHLFPLGVTVREWREGPRIR